MPVWTLRAKRGRVRRWHQRADCWVLAGAKVIRTWESPAAAEAQGFHMCPFCAPPPACCATGTCRGYSLPVLPAADVPEWEPELVGGSPCESD